MAPRTSRVEGVFGKMSVSKRLKSTCIWCTSKTFVGDARDAHLDACPHDDALGQQFWYTGRNAALKGEANIHSDTPAYNMGYEHGSKLKAEIDAKELPGPEATCEPPPRASLPSVTELTLALHEKRHDAPDDVHKAGLRAEIAQRAAAESVIF